MSLNEVVERIQKLMENEDRKDVEFRFLLTASELGDVAKYLTHDSVLNPGARPHGSREDEVLAYGQTFVMLSALAYLRGVSLEESFELGLKNWEDADWRKREALIEDKVTGIIGCPGIAAGEAYVTGPGRRMKDVPEGSILVTPYALPGIAVHMETINGFVTDHGGYTCHAANIARDKGVPCIVGTGNATKLIKHGDTIYLDASGERGEVEKR
jgi:phosphohistidine swiveling domain-containing protein